MPEIGIAGVIVILVVALLVLGRGACREIGARWARACASSRTRSPARTREPEIRQSSADDAPPPASATD